jgi:diphosphomevalonate decarboxylase
MRGPPVIWRLKAWSHGCWNTQSRLGINLYFWPSKSAMKEFSPITQPHLSIPHQVAWQSPSNIALVKYWGKYDPQLPANPSVSLTLNQCRTNTSVWCGPRPSAATGTYSFEFLLSGTPKPDFHPKIEGFFHRISSYLPFLTQVHLRIDSENTFPHSYGK